MANKILAASLIILSITAGIFLVVGLTTPGWFGIIMEGTNLQKIYLNPFYVVYCTSTKCSTEQDTPQKNLVHQMIGKKFFMSGEASAALFTIIAGCILTVMFGIFRLSRRYFYATSSFGASGLAFTVFGWIFCAILTFRYVNLHHDYDWMPVTTTGIEKTVPYSLIIMYFGLFFEGAAIILNILALMKLAASRYVYNEPVVRRSSEKIMTHYPTEKVLTHYPSEKVVTHYPTEKVLSHYPSSYYNQEVVLSAPQTRRVITTRSEPEKVIYSY